MPDLDLGEMETFRSYLATVVRNCVNDYFRSAIRKQKNQDSFVDHEASCGKQYTLPAIEELIEKNGIIMWPQKRLKISLYIFQIRLLKSLKGLYQKRSKI